MFRRDRMFQWDIRSLLLLALHILIWYSKGTLLAVAMTVLITDRIVLWEGFIPGNRL